MLRYLFPAKAAKLREHRSFFCTSSYHPVFTHNNGMVDISRKKFTNRIANASCRITLPFDIADAIFDRREKLNDKGDIIGVSKTAGIIAAKKTYDLIPMCHQVPLSRVSLEISREGEDQIRIRGQVSAFYSTGVEMEALTAVSVAALTFYDMTKSALKGRDDKIIIREIKLDSKEGGNASKTDPAS